MITTAMAALHTGNISEADLCKELLTDRDRLLDIIEERNKTIALQLQLIEAQNNHPLPKIEAGDIDRLVDLALLLRSDSRPFFGAFADSLERVLQNLGEA